jgi:hypothetical protein
MIPDHLRPFQIKSDALKVATGAVLTQVDSNGDQHPWGLSFSLNNPLLN